jgi:hypothetical protein
MLPSYTLTLPQPVIGLTVAGLPTGAASAALLDSLASGLLALATETAAETTAVTPWYAAASVDPEEDEEEQDEDDEDEYEEDEEDQEDGDDEAYDDEEGDEDDNDNDEAEEDDAAGDE